MNWALEWVKAQSNFQNIDGDCFSCMSLISHSMKTNLVPCPRIESLISLTTDFTTTSFTLREKDLYFYVLPIAKTRRIPMDVGFTLDI
ncbi:hypothetical protein Pint_11579 [Pistacia integerrima]|uniref:Uncharacterized protein n=1 Tax=Pistacia integerrima TaxID=434235 RepID=A0ACC0XI08_9ROSI|nr:hypothetical protein Pint_11579 [Pistacia integerrima]